MLLETGVSALPVVDEKRCLLDVYARSDITQLCRGNAYNRLQWEDVTVRMSHAFDLMVWRFLYKHAFFIPSV
jgi:CBS-domain-containing membrane protein